MSVLLNKDFKVECTMGRILLTQTGVNSFVGFCRTGTHYSYKQTLQKLNILHKNGNNFHVCSASIITQMSQSALFKEGCS